MANVWSDSHYAFPTATGKLLDRRGLLRVVERAARRSGLVRVRVGVGVGAHTLRHTYATTALLAGVPIHGVSRNMGCSSVAITADIYGHVTDDALRSASETVRRALRL